MDDDEQQYCLRWNNFQANITSQFEALRDDEDFTDVSLVCDGKRIQAHRVVLSACSPLFKELFKNNPCSHPIIFMRDVDARSVTSLLEFMYAGEVNVAQAHLSSFLRTAESLQIRGLTDPNTDVLLPKKKVPQEAAQCSTTSPEAAVVEEVEQQTRLKQSSNDETQSSSKLAPNNNNNDVVVEENLHAMSADISMKQMKLELPEFSEYFSDVDVEDDVEGQLPGITTLTGLELPQATTATEEFKAQHSGPAYGAEASGAGGRWPSGGQQAFASSQSSRTCEECGRTYSNLSNLRQHMRLVHFPTHPACTICRRRFKTDLYLKRHMHHAHGAFVPRPSFCDANMKSDRCGVYE